MSLDITRILQGWPFEPGQVTARRIRGDDNRELIQLRLDLGLIQMEITGRPDGQRPHGFESLLEHHEQQLERYREQHGGEAGFQLYERDCEMLRAEAVMYYHRYLAEFVLEDYESVERDTRRNLRVMDFCLAHAADAGDRHALEQFRPYVIMMCTRSRAHIELGHNRPKAALAAIQRGIREIEAFLERYAPSEQAAANSAELAVLHALAKEAEARIPVDPVRQLRTALDQAIQEERYEDAAALRDQLRKLGQTET